MLSAAPSLSPSLPLVRLLHLAITPNAPLLVARPSTGMRLGPFEAHPRPARSQFQLLAKVALAEYGRFSDSQYGLFKLEDERWTIVASRCLHGHRHALQSSTTRSSKI
ncbi:hypothetical protein N8I77_000397 [Diaporthe amygdali]|uniref:Uncharacterized protein n=1 Tax=Phomopsis amygdali TaxID=1214568 RepID=A0AAD9W752_PHOAM|nr:hypothetical protein N8I77_000397 [Diaporthe amygdali]